ncbi:hypothetical protein KCP74_21010 [Salmonella enterica subsp. enterica]|nr:hypothetical protein KCP74_21010 [Salmonella enterica subsp. enterica]
MKDGKRCGRRSGFVFRKFTASRIFPAFGEIAKRKGRMESGANAASLASRTAAATRVVSSLPLRMQKKSC